jgi:nucleoside-diphosphate-sugar epimerase
MRVLVTGASSLLGRTVALSLDERGDDVTCFQRSSSGTGLRDLRGDVRDLAALQAGAHGHDALIHLAALVAPRASWSEAYAINVEGSLNAQAVAESCGRFVYISTPSVAFANTPIMGLGAQPSTYTGRDVYARSKAVAERRLLERSNVATVIIRPHLVWGPGDTQLVGRIVQRAKQHRLAMPNQGRSLIDTTYVDDAAAAIVAALDHARVGDEACSKPWVVTGNDPRPVAELLHGIVRAAGLDTPVRSVPAPLASLAGHLADRFWRGTEPPITYFAARQLSLAHWFDQREVQRVLQWSPRVSVDEGLAALTSWYESSAVLTPKAI